MARTLQAAITWLGHSAFLIETAAGKRIVVDPFLSGSPTCPPEFHTLDDLDLILVTHGHADHVGDAIALSQKTGAPIAGMVELMAHLSSLGAPKVIDFNKGGTIHVAGVSVTMTNAFHSSSNDAGGSNVYTGQPAGFVIELEDGYRIYHAGDTCVFGDMRIIGELYRPDLAMLPIGDHYTMSPREAGYAVGLLGVREVLGMHYGTFPPLVGRPAHLREHVPAGVTVHELQPGETLTAVPA